MKLRRFIRILVGILFIPLPILFFYNIYNIGKQSEKENGIKTIILDSNYTTSAAITINKVDKDYVFCDIALRCPKVNYNSLTISSNSLEGISTQNDKTISAKIDIHKTSIYKLDDKSLRNKTSEWEFHNFTNVKFLIPIKPYDKPFSSVNANVHFYLNNESVDSPFPVGKLSFRNLDKNNRISVLSNKSFIENSKDNPELQIFAADRFNKSFHIKFSPNDEFVYVFTTLIIIIGCLLLSLQIYLLTHDKIDNSFIGLVFSLTIGIVSIISFFHNKIADTKSISELIVYTIYFWICIIIAHSTLLIFLKKDKDSKKIIKSNRIERVIYSVKKRG